MKYSDFRKLAITKLIGNQHDNGTWMNNPDCMKEYTRSCIC